MKRIYIFKRGYRNLYFSSLSRLAEHVAKWFMDTMLDHEYPSYFLSQHPSPISYFNGGFSDDWVVYVQELNKEVDAKRIELDELKIALEKATRRLY